ncbi:MAG: DUF3592 domain-containing protein [Alphaproteobacteria bacterium]|nr:DUF3592 domain-containing protein [Alphaproteobacteria bacterium]
MEIVIFVGVVGFVALVLGVPLTALIVWDRRSQEIRAMARSWPTAEGVVELSRVEVIPGDGQVRVRPYVRYAYEVDGQLWRNDCYRLERPFDPGFPGRTAYEIVDALPAGTYVRVHHDPVNPGISCLDP